MHPGNAHTFVVTHLCLCASLSYAFSRCTLVTLMFSSGFSQVMYALIFFISPSGFHISAPSGHSISKFQSKRPNISRISM
jgi:hypothetical protein